MNIKHLTLSNYRNYGSLDIDFGKGFNIIYGNNGQGKTNILEALYLCAFGRSHRGNRDAELIRIGADALKLEMSLQRQDFDTDFEIRISKTETKQISLNGKSIRKISELVGNINVIMFSPEDMSIIKEGPSHRRRFVDILLSQLRPVYFFNLQQYNKVLNQRNSLLREIKNNVGLLKTIDIWNEALASLGGKIYAQRANFIGEIERNAALIHSEVSGGGESLSLRYAPSVKFDADAGEQEIAKAFLHALEKNIEREIVNQTTLSGPQRDDIVIRLNGNDIRQFGSQGQQRSAVLALKFAEIRMMQAQTGEMPVLLLDDVLSELDAARRQYVLESTRDIQTFITCTDRESVRTDDLDAVCFKVEAGTVTTETS